MWTSWQVDMSMFNHTHSSVLHMIPNRVSLRLRFPRHTDAPERSYCDMGVLA